MDGWRRKPEPVYAAGGGLRLKPLFCHTNVAEMYEKCGQQPIPTPTPTLTGICTKGEGFSICTFGGSSSCTGRQTEPPVQLKDAPPPGPFCLTRSQDVWGAACDTILTATGTKGPQGVRETAPLMPQNDHCVAVLI